MFSEEKDAEALKELNGSSQSHPQQPGVSSAPMYALGPPSLAALRPSLPPNLWPHDFLHLAVGLAIFLGFWNPLFTLPLTIAAIMLAIMSRYRSADGDYQSAKKYSHYTVGLLTFAIVAYGSMVYVGFVVGLSYYAVFYSNVG